MSFNDAQTGIETRFMDLWGNTSKVKWENQDWEDPEGEDAYVALSVAEPAGDIIELRQQALTRYSGLIILQVFVQEGKGTKRTGELADAFATIFRRAEFSYGNSGLIRCRIPNKVIVGPVETWYQTNVRCEYIRDVFQARAT